MADADARILDMVRKELEKDRGVATAVLYEKARDIDADIGKLTARQFHAKYPLQIKRAMGGKARKTTKRAGRKRAKKAAKKTTQKTAGKTAKKAAKKSARKATRKTARKATRRPTKRRARRTAKRTRATAGNGRDAVRGLLLQFAKEVAEAEGKADMVDVMTGLEGWVDQIVSASA